MHVRESRGENQSARQVVLLAPLPAYEKENPRYWILHVVCIVCIALHCVAVK
jgi:hypothetical protein